VHTVSVLDQSVACREHVRDRGVNAVIIQGQLARFDRDDGGAGVRVPAAVSPGLIVMDVT
jgi:hypothetical protein